MYFRALPVFFGVRRDLFFAAFFLSLRLTQPPQPRQAVVINLLSIGLGWFLIQPLGMGLKGGALALAAANVAQCALLASTAARLLPDGRAWPRWSPASALTGWKEILSLTLPAAMGMWAEW